MIKVGKRYFTADGYAAMKRPRTLTTRKQMSKSWTTSRKRKLSVQMRENNPMHNALTKKHYNKVMKKARRDPARRRAQSVGQKKSWTKKRRAKFSAHMLKHPELQRKMQENGNQKRKGLPNKAALHYWKSLTPQQRAVRADNLSEKIAANFKGRPNRGFVKGKQGFLTTRFGRLRYDSLWEKNVIEFLISCKTANKLTRDFIILYEIDGKTRRFLVDFRVEFLNRKPLLIEVKCPYFLDTRQTKAKVRAAKLFAKWNNMDFRLVVSSKAQEALNV